MGLQQGYNNVMNGGTVDDFGSSVFMDEKAGHAINPNTNMLNMMMIMKMMKPGKKTGGANSMKCGGGNCFNKTEFQQNLKELTNMNTTSIYDFAAQTAKGKGKSKISSSPQHVSSQQNRILPTPLLLKSRNSHRQFSLENRNSSQQFSSKSRILPTSQPFSSKSLNSSGQSLSKSQISHRQLSSKSLNSTRQFSSKSHIFQPRHSPSKNGFPKHLIHNLSFAAQHHRKHGRRNTTSRKRATSRKKISIRPKESMNLLIAF